MPLFVDKMDGNTDLHGLVNLDVEAFLTIKGHPSTVSRGCLAQIRARVLHRLFLKSIWSKDFKTIFVSSLG